MGGDYQTDAAQAGVNVPKYYVRAAAKKWMQVSACNGCAQRGAVFE